ncbi:MAG: hypothetical protein H6739_05610 [Alphaproteobacteria bacterium]|nr:hypothetical protein [Alphaproteobacteria bacterium]
MSEHQGPVTQQNLSTIAAVAFILALLSLAINFYNYQRTNSVVRGTVKVDYQASQREAAVNERVSSLESQLKELQGRLDAAEAAAAAAAAPAEGEAPK